MSVSWSSRVLASKVGAGCGGGLAPLPPVLLLRGGMPNEEEGDKVTGSGKVPLSLQVPCLRGQPLETMERLDRERQ